MRQETFTRVFAALRAGKIRQPDRLGAFVNSMCNNVLLEHYRASSRDSSLEDEEQKDFPAVTVDVLGAIAAKQMGEKIREILEDKIFLDPDRFAHFARTWSVLRYRAMIL